MSTVVPAVVLTVVVEHNGTQTPGKIIALSARKGDDGYCCPYCGGDCYHMEPAGKFDLVVNGWSHTRCSLRGCEHCRVFLFYPRYDEHVWTADSMSEIEPANFEQNKEFWK